MTLHGNLVSLSKAAALTGRSSRTVQRWVADDRLSVVVLGRTRYVDERQVLEVERDTRRAREGARLSSMLARLDTSVVPSQESGPRPPEDT